MNTRLKFIVDMKTIVIAAVATAALGSVLAADGDSWFPFVISYTGADNASSVAHMLLGFYYMF